MAVSSSALRTKPATRPRAGRRWRPGRWCGARGRGPARAVAGGAGGRGDLALVTLKSLFTSESTPQTVTAVTVGGLCDGARKSVPFLAAAAAERRAQPRRLRLAGRQ